MKNQTAKGYIQFILIIVFLGVIYMLNFVLELMKTEPAIQNKNSEIPVVNAVTIPITEQKLSFSDTAQISVQSYIPVTPEVTGRIVFVAPNFKAGLCFDKNQILFKIDIDQIKARFDTALAELEQAKANLSLVTAEANAAISEWKILNPTLSIPPLVAKEPQIKQANAQIDTAQARVKLAEVDLKHAQFSYPFAGCVESSGVDVGQFANTGQSLGQVFSKESIEVVVNIPNDKADLLKKDAYHADVIIDNKHYDAKIDRISDVIESETQFSKVILKVNTPDNLQPNKIGTVTFDAMMPQKVFVLNDTDIINNNQIRVLNNDDTITIQDINIIGRNEKDIFVKAFDTEIKIVRGIYANLKNNMQVKPTYIVN